MNVNDVLDFDSESELLMGDEDDFNMLDEISSCAVEKTFFDCLQYTYFCPYCGCELEAKIFYDSVHLICPVSSCSSGFQYKNHDDFLKLVKSATSKDCLFIQELPF